MRSVYLTAMGRFGEALSEARRGEEMAPGPATAAPFVPWICAKSRHYLEAVHEWRRVLQMNPDNAWAWAELTFALNRAGRLSEARVSWAEARKRVPPGKDQINDIWLLEYESATGRLTEALEVIASWEARRAHQYVDPYNISVMYSSIGRKDEAMRWLRTAYAERSACLYSMNVDPALDGIRDDRRFKDLLQAMKFPR